MKRQRDDVKALIKEIGLEGFHFGYGPIQHTVVISQRPMKRVSLHQTNTMIKFAQEGTSKVYYPEENAYFDNIEEFRKYILIMQVSGIGLNS